MPIYEFHCPDCDRDCELLVLRNDEEVACPHCQGHHLQRMMSGFAHKTEGGRMVSSSGGGCASCSGGSCASCH